MSTASDDFNRTHGDLISLTGNWTDQAGTIHIFTNAAKGTAGGFNSSYYSATSFTSDHASSITKVDAPYVAAGCRMSGTGGARNWYAHFSQHIDLLGINYRVLKCVAGVVTGIGPTGISSEPVGSIIGISVSGNIISQLVDGVVLNTIIDTDLSTGQPGIVFLNNDASGDDWFGEDVAGPITPTVETLSATTVRSSSAILRGRIDPNAITAIDGRFRWWICAESPPSYTETDPQSLGAGDNPVTYTETLTGLTPSTTYCYQAVSDYGSPELEGEIRQFTTSGEAIFIDGTVSHPLTWIEMYIEDGDV